MPENMPGPKAGVRNPGATLTEELKRKVLKATAIKQAMLEVFDEHRDEIVKRSKAKLKAFGIDVQDEDLTGP